MFTSLILLKGGDITEAMNKGAKYLSKYYYKSKDPLEIAITTYALFVTDQNTNQQAFAKLRAKNKTGEHMIYVW